ATADCQRTTGANHDVAGVSGCRGLQTEPFKVTSEQRGGIPSDVGLMHCPIGGCESSVMVDQYFGDGLARVAPLVDELVEHTRIRVWRRKAGPQQFQAHSGDLLRHTWDIGEPPAAENMEIAEFAGDDTELMLVLPRQSGDEILVFREFGAHSLQRPQP